MDLIELISRDRVFLGLRAADKAALLNDLAKRAAAVIRPQPSQIVASLVAREALGSTGIGSGIAIPHARLKDLSGFTGLFARLERPIDFVAIDGKPVDLVFLLLSPTWGNTEHLAALAAVSRRLRDRPVADAIRNATSASEIHALLTGAI